MNACRCTHSILIRAAKTPKKTAIKLCYKQNQLYKQIKPPAVVQGTFGSCWGGHSTQGAQRVALTPAHCGHRARTLPLSRKADIFWNHPCYFTCLDLFLHLCSNTRAFQKVLGVAFAPFPYRLAGGEVLPRAQWGCSWSRSSSKRQTDQTHRYPGSSELFFTIHFDFKGIAEREDAPEGQD